MDFEIFNNLTHEHKVFLGLCLKYQRDIKKGKKKVPTIMRKEFSLYIKKILDTQQFDRFKQYFIRKNIIDKNYLIREDILKDVERNIDGILEEDKKFNEKVIGWKKDVGLVSIIIIILFIGLSFFTLFILSLEKEMVEINASISKINNTKFMIYVNSTENITCSDLDRFGEFRVIYENEMGNVVDIKDLDCST